LAVLIIQDEINTWIYRRVGVQNKKRRKRKVLHAARHLPIPDEIKQNGVDVEGHYTDDESHEYCNDDSYHFLVFS